MKETLTYPEWAVMEALWDNPPQTLSEVIASMGEKMGWSYRTYASYLRKLCDKGLAGFQAKGRDKFYYAIADKHACIRAEGKGLLQKVSEGSTKELLISMIEESGLNAAEHAELSALLVRLSKGGRKQ